MSDIALLLKSYRGDIDYARRLIESFSLNNRDQLTMHCVVPAEDVKPFSSLMRENVVLHAEEELVGKHLVREPIGDLRVGYANQEIVKMSFWETGLARNYFCVDSDAVFIRAFGASDFMRDDTTPYSVLVEDNDLKVDPVYFERHWRGRERAIRAIMHEVGLEDPIMRTSHGHQIFSSVVWQSFVSDFLQPRGWTYRDALACSPYEFSWYAMWLQKAAPIEIHEREPLVKVFHTEEQHLASLMKGVRQSDLARGYLAVVVNSNFSRDRGLIDATGEKATALAPYLSYQELTRLALTKVRNSFRPRKLN